MNPHLVDALLPGRSPAATLLDVGWKSSLLLVATLAILALLGRRRVLARSAAAHAALLGLLLLPLLSATLPRWVVVETPQSSPAPVVDAPSPIADPLPSEVADAAPADAPPIPIAAPAPIPVAPQIDWPGVVLGAITWGYLIVAAGRLIGLATALLAARRLVRDARPVVSPAIEELTQRTRAALGIGRAVMVRSSARVGVPVVVGWRKPTVLLPDRMIDEAGDPSDLAAILLHELAHVRRGDYGWNLALRLMLAVYWPHPLAWLLASRVAQVREEACDDLCLSRVGSSYRDALLSVARGLGATRLAPPSLGLAMARRSALRRRIERLGAGEGSRRCLSGRGLRSSLLIASVALAAWSAPLNWSRDAAPSRRRSRSRRPPTPPPSTSSSSTRPTARPSPTPRSAMTPTPASFGSPPPPTATPACRARLARPTRSSWTPGPPTTSRSGSGTAPRAATPRSPRCPNRSAGNCPAARSPSVGP